MSQANTQAISVWSFLRPYLSKSKLFLCAFLIIVLLAGLEQSLQAYFFKLVVDTVTNTEPADLLKAILIPAALYVSMDLYHNIAMRSYLYTCMKYYPELKRRVMHDLFEYTAKHSVSFFQTNLSGDIAGKIQDVAYTVEPLIRNIFEIFIGRIMIPVVVIIFLAFVSLKIAFVFLIWTIIFVPVTLKLSKPVATTSHQLAADKNFLSGRLVDILGNIVTAKMFGRTTFEQEKLDESIERVKQSEADVHWTQLKLHFTQGLFTFVLLGTLMAILIQGRIQGIFTIGDFVFVLTLMSTCLAHIYALGRGVGDAIKFISEFKQALNILLLPHDIIDKPGAKPLVVNAGSISISNLNFSYTPEAKVFNEFNLEVAAGEKVGIVGSSGGGKSTLINLLLRLIEPQSGIIQIDGQDIQDVTLKSLRQQITLVPQQIDLFHRSILDNIRYGNLEANDEQIKQAAVLAECDDFIRQMPDGYATMVGERGVKLSGGQKQRIAIARAYLKPAKILILDEATSALDSITESYIQSSLTKIMQDKTTFVIAHRLATLKQVDRILVFDNGQIVQDGRLDDLIEQPGLFAQLWEHQYFTDAH